MNYLIIAVLHFIQLDDCDILKYFKIYSFIFNLNELIEGLLTITNKTPLAPGGPRSRVYTRMTLRSTSNRYQWKH